MKLALVAPAYSALGDDLGTGHVQLLLWEGTPRDLRLTEAQRAEGNLTHCLTQWHATLQSYERIVCILPESQAYWFEPEVPFTQRRKLEAVLSSVLEDEWPDDMATADYRFDVAQGSAGPRARACVVERSVITQLEARFAAASVSIDGIMPAATALAKLATGSGAYAMIYDEHLTLRLPSSEGPIWSTLRLPATANVQQEFELAIERASRSMPAAAPDSPMLLSLDAVLEAPAGYAQVPAISGIRSTLETSLPLPMWGILATEAVRSSHYLFGSRRRTQNPFADMPVRVSPRMLVAVGIAGLCLVASSMLSLGFKRAEADSYRSAAEAIFVRTFPEQTPAANVAKQARALLGGGEAPGSERRRNPSLLATMAEIQRAMPAAGAATIEKVDIVGHAWNLAGQCVDFGCVDTLKAGLEKAPNVGEVKVNSAKQGVNKDKIKFSLTVKGKDEDKKEATE